MRDKIISILCEIKGDLNIEEISDDADLINDIGLDSLQMINFLLQIEDEFDIEVDFEELDYNLMRSISKFTQFIENQIEKSTSILD
jgi:acyl carrier protein